MIKKLSVIIITIMMLASMASAYVPPEYRTGEHMSEYEVIKVALTAYDAGSRDRWMMDTLEDAIIHHTNSARTQGGTFAQLREWLYKIESQKSGKITPIPIVTNPENLAIQYSNDGLGWCRGYDDQCRNKVT